MTRTSPKLPKSLLRQITHHKDAIARHRDELRDVHDDLRSFLDSADEALAGLEGMLDTLSQYV